MDIFSPRIGPFRSPPPPRSLQVVDIPHTNVPTIYCVVLATMPLTLVPAILILPNPFHVTNVWKHISFSIRRCLSWIFGPVPRPLSPPEGIEVINRVMDEIVSVDEDKGEITLMVDEGSGEGKVDPADTALPSTEPGMVETFALEMHHDGNSNDCDSSQDLFHVIGSTTSYRISNINSKQRLSQNDVRKSSRPSSFLYSSRVRISPSDSSFRKGRSSSSLNSRPRWKP